MPCGAGAGHRARASHLVFVLRPRSEGDRIEREVMLVIRDLVKIYPGPVTALAGVDLDVPNGNVRPAWGPMVRVRRR